MASWTRARCSSPDCARFAAIPRSFRSTSLGCVKRGRVANVACACPRPSIVGRGLSESRDGLDTGPLRRAGEAARERVVEESCMQQSRAAMPETISPLSTYVHTPRRRSDDSHSWRGAHPLHGPPTMPLLPSCFALSIFVVVLGGCAANDKEPAGELVDDDDDVNMVLAMQSDTDSITIFGSTRIDRIDQRSGARASWSAGRRSSSSRHTADSGPSTRPHDRRRSSSMRGCPPHRPGTGTPDRVL